MNQPMKLEICGNEFRNRVISRAARNLTVRTKALRDSAPPVAPRNDRVDEFFRSLLQRHRFLALLLFAFLVPAVVDAQKAPPPPPPYYAQFRVHFPGSQGAWLGVYLKEVAAQDVKALKLPGEYGAIVQRVEPGSPAAKAGIEPNDVILDFGGMRVWSAAQLSRLVRETPPGRTVTLLISRAGRRLSLKTSLAQREARMMMPHHMQPRPMPPMNFHFHFRPGTFDFPFAPARERLGVTVETLTPQLANYFGVKQGKGVLVSEVEAGSPAAKAGIKAGDCIVEAGSKAVGSVSGLAAVVRGLEGQNPKINLTLVRAGRERAVTATLRTATSPSMEMKRQALEQQLQRKLQAIQQQIPSLQQIEKQLEQQHIQQKIQQQLQKAERSVQKLESELSTT